MTSPASRPAQEAIQWTYFGYLAAVKSQNGAAMSLGRTSTFLDIFIERDIAAGKSLKLKLKNDRPLRNEATYGSFPTYS